MHTSAEIVKIGKMFCTKDSKEKCPSDLEAWKFYLGSEDTTKKTCKKIIIHNKKLSNAATQNGKAVKVFESCLENKCEHASQQPKSYAVCGAQMCGNKAATAYKTNVKFNKLADRNILRQNTSS